MVGEQQDIFIKYIGETELVLKNGYAPIFHEYSKRDISRNYNFPFEADGFYRF
jgi:hypothetical protein